MNKPRGIKCQKVRPLSASVGLDRSTGFTRLSTLTVKTGPNPHQKTKREPTAASPTRRGVRTGVKLYELCDLAGLQVDADGVVHLDEGVWVADGAGIMGHQVGDSLGADDDLLDLAQLVLQKKGDLKI